MPRRNISHAQHTRLPTARARLSFILDTVRPDPNVTQQSSLVLGLELLLKEAIHVIRHLAEPRIPIPASVLAILVGLHIGKHTELAKLLS